MNAPDVVVIGAGVVGLAAARRLAGAGARVTVVEGSRIGAEASSAAAGMLGVQTELNEDSALLELALQARDHHASLAPALEAETGVSVERSQRGLLEVAFSDGEMKALTARASWQRARRLPVETLSAPDLRDAEPNLNPAARGGLLFPADRTVDNVRLVRALAASAVGRGATLVAGRPVTELLVEGGRVRGVKAGGERVAAGAVLNAAGAWGGLLAGDPCPPPIEPIRGQIATFDVSPAALRHGVVSARGYVVPRADGRLLAGSTSERAGFDKSVTAAGLRSVLGIALEIVPLLADVRVSETWAGLRPGTPDGLPVLGASSLPGLFVAGGLFRHGILLGPLVGEIGANLVLGEGLPPVAAAFDPARFRAA